VQLENSIAFELYVDEQKTLKEKQDEERLLNELMEVVSLRNNIVDSIEVDRQRFAVHHGCSFHSWPL